MHEHEVGVSLRQDVTESIMSSSERFPLDNLNIVPLDDSTGRQAPQARFGHSALLFRSKAHGAILPIYQVKLLLLTDTFPFVAVVTRWPAAGMTEAKRQTIRRPANSKEATDIRLLYTKDSVKEGPLRAVLKQALSEIDDTDSMAKKAIEMLDPELDQLAEAASSARALVVQKIADETLKSISKNDYLTHELVEAVSLDQTLVRPVVDALRVRLSNTIQQVALSSLADSRRTAEEIARSIPTDGTEIQAVVTTLRERLISEVRDDLIRQLQSADEIIDEIRASLPDDSESPDSIRRRPFYMQVEEARWYALSQLSDASEVSAQIRADLEDLSETVLRISTKLQAMLTAEAKRRSLETDNAYTGDESASGLDVLNEPVSAIEAADYVPAAGTSSDPGPIERTAMTAEQHNITWVDSETSGVVLAKEDRQQTKSPFWQSLESLCGEKSAPEAGAAVDPSLECVQQDETSSASICDHDDACADDNSAWTPQAKTASGKKPPAIAAQDDVYYIYGIMASSADGLTGPMPPGIQSCRVDAVDYDGLSAIVSVVPADVFSGPTLKSNLSNAGWLQENVSRHAEIIDQLRSRQTFLPMPFCTILRSHDRILSMLQSNSDSYHDAIRRVSGKQEWVLRIYRSKPVQGDGIYEDDRNFKRALNGQSHGVLEYLREEMKRAEPRARFDPRELVTDHCTQRSHEALVSISAEARMNRNGNGQSRPSEGMVLNAAYLVEDSSESEIRTEVERLKAEYAELGFRFDLKGPLPPYHFVNGADGRRQAV